MYKPSVRKKSNWDLGWGRSEKVFLAGRPVASKRRSPPSSRPTLPPNYRFDISKKLLFLLRDSVKENPIHTATTPNSVFRTRRGGPFAPKGGEVSASKGQDLWNKNQTGNFVLRGCTSAEFVRNYLTLLQSFCACGPWQLLVDGAGSGCWFERKAISGARDTHTRLRVEPSSSYLRVHRKKK